MQRSLAPIIAGCVAVAALAFAAPRPASALTAVTPLHYGETDAGIVQPVGRYYRGRGYRNYGYGRGYRNYGYRNYGYRRYGYGGYGYRRYGYGGYGYRPYGYYGGYGYPYWRRPGINLWFGF
jgi:hypothetical protein